MLSERREISGGPSVRSLTAKQPSVGVIIVGNVVSQRREKEKEEEYCFLLSFPVSTRRLASRLFLL